MHSLPIFVRLAGRAVILLGDGEAAAAKRRLLERAGARIVGEAAEASLAIVALEDDRAAHDAVARLRARGILVNATDRPALCDFTLPAIVDRDPLIVAVGSDGASAGLAKAIRQRIEALLPPTLGPLASALAAARAAMRARWPQAAGRRAAVDAALEEGGPLDPLRADTGAVDAWLEAPDAPASSGVTRIRLRSPDPDDLSLREARLLGRADRIYHGRDVPPAILARARADAQRIAGHPPRREPEGLSIDLDFA